MMLKRIAERGQPCRTPALKGISAVHPSLVLMEVKLLVYRSSRIVIRDLIIPVRFKVTVTYGKLRK